MLIHIGYHKTASTALQDYVFRREDSGFACWPDDRKLVHPYLVCRSPYEPVSEDARADLQRQADEAREVGRCFVISHERLSGYFATGGFDSEAIARRLAAAFPAARVLVVVREQGAMLESFYSQYISDGGVLPFRKFMRPISQNLRRAPEFDLDYLCYDRLVACYRSLFGAERVLVLPFELLRSDPAGFVSRIGTHCSVSVDAAAYAGGLPRTNERRSVLVQGIIRQVNRLQRSQLNPGGLFETVPVHRAGQAHSRRLSGPVDALTPGFVERAILEPRRRHIAKLIDGYYAASNARLEEMTGLALGDFGYSLPGAPPT
jgi:hypothetical protein